MEANSGSTRPEHNYPPQTQELVVSMANGVGKSGRVTPIAPKTIVKFKGAPSLSTVELWRQKRSASTSEPSLPTKRGRQEILPRPEQLITGGWALRQLEKGKIVSIQRIRTFIKVRSPKSTIFQPSSFCIRNPLV
jgi:hypothetical protein